MTKATCSQIVFVVVYHFGIHCTITFALLNSSSHFSCVYSLIIRLSNK
jgi:hypothetical protein